MPDHDLLDTVFESVKEEMKNDIDTQDTLSVSFDESNDVSSNRIMNIAIDYRPLIAIINRCLIALIESQPGLYYSYSG